MKKINLKQLGQIRLVTVNKGDKAIKAICKFLGLDDIGNPIWNIKVDDPDYAADWTQPFDSFVISHKHFRRSIRVNFRLAMDHQLRNIL